MGPADGAEAGGTARDAVLSAARRALGVRGDEAGRRGLAQARLLRPPRASGEGEEVRPGQGSEALAALFAAKLEGQGATVVRVAESAAPAAVAALLEGAGLPLRARAGADPLIAALPWAAAGMEILAGAAAGDDRASVSRALAGAAETGTLVLASGPENPSTLNFLPETHIVLIAAAAIVGSYEEVWERIRYVYGRRRLPRTVNWVSGPSRTADIEQRMVRGAHGPKRLGVIILG